MLTVGGSEAALLVIAVAAIGWVRRRVIIELARPLRFGPFLIRIRSSPRSSKDSHVSPHKPQSGK
jgi:hypothetical protein